MQIIHSDMPISWDGPHPHLFLAGPTPRDTRVVSWRPDAIAILQRLGFSGTVLVPERRDWQVRFDYQDQVEWEFEGLQRADVIAFWVPRDLDDLPGFTTNVEFGRYADSNRIVYGRPADAPRTRYLDWLYQKCTGLEPCATLETTLRAAIARTPGLQRTHRLIILPGNYAICRLPPETPVPAWAAGEFVSITRAPDELSIICAEENVPADVLSERGWRCLRVAGTLDFSLVGVLSSLLVPLARAGVSVVANSTYDTDYLMVKENALPVALSALQMTGCMIESMDDLR